ncbi:uncharacterized protein FOMMEDRAFT_163244 [Fomitiporia mediterranea MF3/22]|uniref:Uncharacterized protein n=1 Tax=Fomitiporia mediterranea (strain MF3/22) TaxID=694068 RepID=R7SFF8_FOMME|nr:uncharacterized protein FOMMEDRAFT_163244 [Fomitiporia mediterranea MF3/22]EJC97461.1 hypothetical protein FOMMEDRAFT_163244 [Fomitiporia mediterranea MF3/22]
MDQSQTLKLAYERQLQIARSHNYRCANVTTARERHRLMELPLEGFQLLPDDVRFPETIYEIFEFSEDRARRFLEAYGYPVEEEIELYILRARVFVFVIIGLEPEMAG